MDKVWMVMAVMILTMKVIDGVSQNLQFATLIHVRTNAEISSQVCVHSLELCL